MQLLFKKEIFSVLLWHSRLRIWHNHCSGLGQCCGTGSLAWELPLCCRCGPKKGGYFHILVWKDLWRHIVRKKKKAVEQTICSCCWLWMHNGITWGIFKNADGWVSPSEILTYVFWKETPPNKFIIRPSLRKTDIWYASICLKKKKIWIWFYKLKLCLKEYPRK